MLIFDLMTAYREGNTVFHEGKELTNSAAWKNRTNAANKLVALFGGVLALAKVAGYDIQVDEQTLSQVAIGVAAGVALVNNVVHVVTSTKIGISQPDSAD